MTDPLQYYHLEQYLFQEVHARFHNEHAIGALDFFSIVIWKANRAKPAIAAKLVRYDPKHRSDLDLIVRDLTHTLFKAPQARDRLRILIEDWKFVLPMASAILSVLWPDQFGVYDVRVCDQLGRFHNLKHRTNFESMWPEYENYISAVKSSTPERLSLRDKDRYLWGQDVMRKLKRDIQNRFQGSTEVEA